MNPIRVLLVEDNPGDVRIIKEMLGDSINFKVSVGVTLEDGVNYLLKNNFDIVLLDLNLPDSHGKDTLKIVNQKTPGIPIIILTGFSDEKFAISTLEMGAQDYIVKGQTDKNLLARSMRYAIERKKIENNLKKTQDELEVRSNILDHTVKNLKNEIVEREKTTKKLGDSKSRYKTLFNSSPDFTILANAKGKILNANKAAQRITGLSHEDIVGKYFTDTGILPEEDLQTYTKNVSRLLNGDNIKPYESRLFDKNGEFRYVETYMNRLEKFDELIAFQVISHDITERKKAENEIIASLNEKDILLREIHHRVKNNLQIISSLLNLQSKYVDGNEIAVDVLKESQNRVKSMAMLHEKLYQSKNFSRIKIVGYIERLVSDLLYSYASSEKVVPVLDVEDIELNIETAVPCGLITSELISNTLKYAFPDKLNGKLKISLKKISDKYELTIGDDGIGFPESLDFRRTDSLGLKIVNSLVDQIEGEITLDSTKGTEFKIIFNELEYKDRI